MFDSPVARRFALVGAAIIAFCGSMPTAYAEGGFNSSLTSVRVGFDTRSWYDANVDAVSTSISHYSKCQAGPTSVTYRLYRERSLLPDVNMGEKKLMCNTTGTAYFGDVVSGNYHANVSAIAGASSVSVADWRLRY